MPYLIPTTEPFLFAGDGKKTHGCLLIHGFTGTPKEMRWLGEYLNRRGYPVLGVRLAGHATRPPDMVRTRYQDWLASVEDGYHMLRGLAREVVVIGLSMGGALALTFAADFPVRGVVSMAAPYALPPDPRIRSIRWRSLWQPFIPKEDEPGAGWFDPTAWQDHISYPYHPTRSILELDYLLQKMHTVLPRLSLPILLMHSRDDDFVPPEHLEKIAAQLQQAHPEIHWLQGSGHVITRDAARLTAFEHTLNFINRLEQDS